MAAIATLDAAVVESGGEVITLADRQAAITELDAAVEQRERSERETKVRLFKALAEAQRVRAWDGDEGFMAALAAGAVTATGERETQFTAWVEHRYGWKPSHAMGLGRAGRTYLALEEGARDRALPENEYQVRPLTRLLGKHEDSISSVWQQARAEADDYLARHPGKGDPVARYVDGIVREQWPELFEKPAATQDQLHDELDRKLRQFRSAYDWLRDRMDRDDFEERVLAWLAHNPY